MSEHIVRDPATVPGAVLKIVKELGGGEAAKGWAKAAAIVGKTPEAVKKWGNPNAPAEPSLRDALALDAAYWEACGLEPPLFVAYSEQISVATQGTYGSRDLSVDQEALRLFTHVAGVVEEVQRARAPDSPGGPVITPTEQAGIHQRIAEVADSKHRLKQAVEQEAATGRRRGR